MQVILLEKVVNLGNLGDVVKVKDGYARNFLLREGKALRATEANKTKFERDRAALEARNAERRAAAGEEAKSLDGKVFTLIRQMRGGKELPLKAIVDEGIALGGCDTLTGAATICRRRVGQAMQLAGINLLGQNRFAESQQELTRYAQALPGDPNTDFLLALSCVSTGGGEVWEGAE